MILGTNSGVDFPPVIFTSKMQIKSRLVASVKSVSVIVIFSLLASYDFYNNLLTIPDINTI